MADMKITQITFVASTLFALTGCASSLYWQDTKDVPKSQLAALKLSEGWRGRTYSLKIDGKEVASDNIDRVYIKAGKYTIEEDARRLDRCTHRVRTTYIDRKTGNRVGYPKMTCEQYSYTRRTRKGELTFEAGYEYNLFDFYVYLLPVVAGKEGKIEHENVERVRRMGDSKRPLE
ncbi:MAG: hypothetical protein GC149_01645 [Gammaproteobacteria bacterium]|nr:hypothetical protein [Gammaproteobacteria bacterium]